jgi:membrane protein
MQKNSRDLADFMRFIATRFQQDRCTQVAASLTFTTLLSLVPLATIALTLFSAFPVFEDYSSQIKVFLLNNLMPDLASKVITQYMQQFTESAMRLTAVGIGLLAVTAMLLLTLAPLLVGVSLALTSWLVGLADAAHIRTAELLRLFVLDGAPLPDGKQDDPL